jgi:hypothetical protein
MHTSADPIGHSRIVQNRISKHALSCSQCLGSQQVWRAWVRPCPRQVTCWTSVVTRSKLRIVCSSSEVLQLVFSIVFGPAQAHWILCRDLTRPNTRRYGVGKEHLHVCGCACACGAHAMTSATTYLQRMHAFCSTVQVLSLGMESPTTDGGAGCVAQ